MANKQSKYIPQAKFSNNEEPLYALNLTNNYIYITLNYWLTTSSKFSVM